MRKLATTAFILSLILCALLLSAGSKAHAQSVNRRGNAYATNPLLEFYVVDSDDDLGIKPTYNFVDTTYGTWNRVTGFTDPDDGYAYMPTVSPALTMQWYQVSRTLPNPVMTYVTTNGYLVLDSSLSSGIINTPNNQALPTFGPQASIVAPLWADWEFRTTGDSSKVYFRAVTDSFYVSYYNLALKGTNGKVRATFQIAFTSADTSVTFNYRSFEGAVNGVPAAQLIQKRVTIGVQNNQAVYGTTYLNKGTYSAVSYSSALYALNLHDQLAVKFIRRQRNQVRITSINTPPYERYELSGNTLAPSVTVEDLTDSAQIVYVHTQIENIGTGATVYSRTDSVLVSPNSTATLTHNTMTGINAGVYRMTSRAYVPKLGDSDPWPADNYKSRTFTYFVNQTSYPFIEDFTNGMNYSAWSPYGAQVVRGDSVEIDAESPRQGISGALLLDRRDADGNLYTLPNAGDTVTSAPINLNGKGTVYLTFSYQRGVKTDSSQAGIALRTLSGPERTVLNTSGSVVQQGDTLLVEGLPSGGSALNPSASSWVTLAAIDGGIDNAMNKYRVQLPSSCVNDHFRLRFRLLGHDNTPTFGPPFDDDDSWVVDDVQLYNTSATTDLEPTGVDFGNGNFTHIPRNVAQLLPKIHISNNGGVVQQSTYVARLVIKDQLARTVYFRTQGFSFPVTRGDSTITMPLWNILGSQGGVFSVSVSLEQLLWDYNHLNDTNTFTRTMYIDDVYALDDGKPDTAGTMTSAHTEWYYNFTPLSNDSLRGADMYDLDPNGGTMSFALQIKHDTTTIANRSFGVTSTAAGFARGTFQPLYLAGGTTYSLHFTQTAGPLLGGDASKGLVWVSTADATTPTYGTQHPDILGGFFEPGHVSYVASAGTNGAGGGLTLPMFRLVFAGSSNYLPVELVSFTGSRTGNAALLNWTTAKEENVFEFEVERANGSSWITVGQALPHAGTAGGDYSIVDPTAPAGQVTYRLRERDLDGSIHELGTKTLAAVGTAPSFEVGVYPNPASNSVKLSLSDGAVAKRIRLYDLLGRSVADIAPTGNSEVALDVSTIASGVYYLEVESAAGNVRKQLTITR